ncbi:MAG TPA: GAF domain-containing protein, partial [Anaerolineae bacterium]
VQATIGTGLFAGHIGERLKAGEGLAGTIWRTGQPMAVADYRDWSGRSALFEGEPNGPAVGVPLRSGSEIVGVIGLTRAVSAPPFGPDEIDLMARFAQLASIALENARLHTSVQAELRERQRAEDALEQRLKLERLITSISTQFINLAPDEIDNGIRHALRAIGEFAGAERSYVYQFCKERACMNKTHEWCASDIESQIEPLQDYPLDHFQYIRQTISQQNILNVPRIADLPPEAKMEKEEFERQGVRSFLCVPIVYRGMDMGYLGFHTVRQEKQWNDSHATLLKITGEIFANALENQRAQEELQAAYENLERRVQERTHELAALNTIASVVSRSLDLNEILTAALDKTLQAVGMEFGGAYRLEESGDETPAGAKPRRFLNPLAYHGLSETFVRRAGAWSLEGSATQVALESGQPFVWRVEESSPKFGMTNALIEEGIQQIVTVPLLAQSRLVGALYLATGKARSLTPEQLSLLSAIGRQVGVAVDNARLYKGEKDRHAEAERRRQVAEGLRETLAVLNSMLPLRQVLDHIVSQARRLLQSDAAALFRLDHESQILAVQASQGLGEEFVQGLKFQLGGRGAVAEAVRTKSPTTFKNLGTLLRNVDIPSESRPFVDHFTGSFSSVLAVPLILKDAVYGAIALYSHAAREFTEEDLLLASTFGDQVALALENAQLRDQVREAAAVTERSRLARELHDSVTQQLYSMNLYAEAAARLLIGGEARQAAEHLRELRDTAQEALREMRLLIFELRPLALEKTGLGTALQTRLDSVESRGGIKAELVVTGTEHLTSRVQQELYHIAQEALNNALKHSDAGHVQIRLAFLEESTCLEIHDDGVGFATDQTNNKGGLGLAGMKERAMRIGAKLQIESEPGKGTTIAVQVPMRGGK